MRTLQFDTIEVETQSGDIVTHTPEWLVEFYIRTRYGYRASHSSQHNRSTQTPKPSLRNRAVQSVPDSIEADTQSVSVDMSHKETQACPEVSDFHHQCSPVISDQQTETDIPEPVNTTAGTCPSIGPSLADGSAQCDIDKVQNDTAGTCPFTCPSEVNGRAQSDHGERNYSESVSSDEEWEQVVGQRRRRRPKTVKGVIYCHNQTQAIKVAQEAIREEVASKVELLVSRKRKSGKSVALTLSRNTLPDTVVIGGQILHVHPFLQKAACGADRVPVDRCTNLEPGQATFKESMKCILQSLQQLILQLG